MDETKDEMLNLHSGLLSKEDVVLLDQTERIRRFGLECVGPLGDGIIFKAGHWQPGGEYVQKLIVRNVSTSVKKFKYKLPTTRYFSLAYPEIIILSPGMYKELDVIFRPVEYNPYDDTLFIKMVEGAGSGGFHVPVRATIDKLILSSPFGLDLGYCPTHQTTSVIFQLTNTGEVDAPFRWQQAQPFVIEPSEGVVPTGQAIGIRVSIYPTDASVFVAAATCIVGEGVHAIIPEPIVTTRISAIGKYTYIVLSENVADFGEVLSGTPPDAVKKEILLRNNSVVPAEYELVRHESDTDEVFEITPRSGVLPPQSQIPLTIKYSALASGCYSLDRYTFRTPGGCQTMLTCQGLAMPSIISAFKDTGTGVSLTAHEYPEGSPANAINFRDIEVGKTETRILFLKNASKKDATFNILSGATGIFQVHPVQGTIPALSQAFPIKFTFSPPRPINYCRRVFVLIGDNTPIFYDIMGSGFIRARGEIKEQRPAPLRFAHIQAYRNRAVQGLGGLSPPELDEMCSSNEGEARFFAQPGMQGTRAMAVTAVQNPLTRTGETTRVAVASAHELFIEDTDGTCREVTLNKTSLDFGYTPYQSSSDAQTISVTNNTNGKVCLVWELPADVGSRDLHDPNSTSTASRCAFDIEPATCDIGPGQTEKFKVVFRPKQSNRNFLAELEAFVYFKNQRTFRLVNDTTLTPPWCLTVKALGHTFATGQLLATIKMTGSNVKHNKLIFPTCFEGESTYQTFMLRNTSNLPSTFKFELGFNATDSLGRSEASSSQVFTVTPVCGEVNAEGFVLVSVRFSPTTSRKYTQLVRCIVNGDQGGRLLIEGNASVPFVCFPEVKNANGREPTEHDVRFDGISLPPQSIPRGFQGSFYLKPTHIGLSTSRQLVLKNGSRLPLRFRLNLPAEASGIVSVTPTRGILRGNETIVLTAAFAPRLATKYVFKLRCKVVPVGGRAQRVIDARQAMGVAQPECVQNLSIYLVAPGEIGAVLFSPPAVELPVRLVNTSESTDIFLENISDSDLSYEVHYREEFQGDSGGTAKDVVTQSELRLLTSERSGPADETSLFCQAPVGILNARSRLRVVFTYEPTRAGLFNFLLLCKLKAIDPVSGEALMLPNEETALLRTQGNAVSDPLVATITSRASFPRLIIDDLRVGDDSLISDVELLWRQCDLAPLNFDLSLPLSEAECQMNAGASADIGKLKKFSFDFTPAVVGSPVQTLYFRLRNSGYLTASFHLHLPNEKQLDLEQWCDEDEPSEELNKVISIIEELKSFSITPLEATLEPGETCVLSISYSYSSLKYGGVHRLPVHFKVDQGKQLQLELNGRTLPSSNSSLVADPSKPPVPLTNRDAPPPTDILLSACTGRVGEHTLAAVPVGLTAPETPRQKVEIANVSGTDAIYDIDMQAVERLIADNYGVPILRIANPSGSIKARSSVFIEVYFFPLEATTYKLPIIITYKAEEVDNGFEPPKSMRKPLSIGSPQSTVMSSQIRRGDLSAKRSNTPSVLTFTLRMPGFDPRQPLPPRLGTDVVGGAPGVVQLLRLPKQLASCSTDILDFSVVPQGCSASHLVILRNLHETAELDFTITDSCSLLAEGLLSVFPTNGRILPGKQALLDFKFSAECRPMLISDRVKIEVREIVKVSNSRRGQSSSKAMARLMARKSGGVQREHESVIKRITAARASQLMQNPTGEGKQASMPTTVNARGDILASFRNGEKNGGGGAANGSSVAGGISFESFNEGGTGTGAGLGGGLGGSSIAQSRSLDAESTASGADRSTLRTPESTSSRASRRSRGGEDDGPAALKGDMTMLIVRIKGQVHPVETCNVLFGRGPLLGMIDRFLLPTVPLFVPPLPANVSQTNSVAPYKPSKVSDFTVDPARQSEVRNVGEEVLFDLFRSLLESFPVTEYTRDVMGMQPASAAATAADASVKVPRVASTVGVYYSEICKSGVSASKALSSSSSSSSDKADAVATSESSKTLPLLRLSERGLTASDLAEADVSSPSKRKRDAERRQNEALMDTSSQAALADPDFVDLASDILRNTMFNLMQEAAFDEFPIYSEPLKFLLRK